MKPTLDEVADWICAASAARLDAPLPRMAYEDMARAAWGDNLLLAEAPPDKPADI